MDETVIVIMLKDNNTGFLEKELGSYSLSENAGMIYNIYGEDTEDGRKVVLRLTCDRDVEDWEYDAIFDYYDTDALVGVATHTKEEDGQLNPIWVVQFPYSDVYEEMENTITNILEVHKKELLSVYDAIADKKDDYSEK